MVLAYGIDIWYWHMVLAYGIGIWYDPRILTMPGRGTSDFHRLGRHIARTKSEVSGERAYSFVACLSHLTIPLTTHPFLDGAPFLLLGEAPPSFRCGGGYTQFMHNRSRMTV